MKKLLIGLSVLLVLLFSGCAKRITSLSNIKNVPVQERNVAIIKDDYFHYRGVINKISFLNKSTGKFEEIYSKAIRNLDIFLKYEVYASAWYI